MGSPSRAIWIFACVVSFALQWTAIAAQDTINHDAQPYPVAMVNNASLGSDGNAISICFERRTNKVS